MFETDDGLLQRLIDLLRRTGVGNQLPPERELSEKLGASRTALRDRLRLLESSGAITRSKALGTVVSELRPATVSQALLVGLSASNTSVASFGSVRVAMERQAAKLASGTATELQIAFMSDAVRRMSTAPDKDELYRSDLAFHEALFTASGDDGLIFFSSVMHELFEASVTERRARMRKLSSDRTTMVELHQTICDGVRSGDPEKAMRAVDHHFDTLDELSERLGL